MERHDGRHPGHGWVVDGYVEHFRHSLGPADEATVALIDELLHVGVRCVGLSNWSAITWAGITDAYPALGRLEGVVISGEEGTCKPDQVIFRHNDLDHLETILKSLSRVRPKLIAFESVYSMDGDIADLKGICDLADKYQAMVMVDD